MVHYCAASGAESKVQLRSATQKAVRLTGRFGVFAPGRVALHFLDGQGKVLGRENLAEPVSPLTPVVLDRAAKLPDGTATVRLVFVDAAGKEAGGLAIIEGQVL
ncbi:MAG: hypothetical protein WCK89_02100 [bacterium]